MALTYSATYRAAWSTAFHSRPLSILVQSWQMPNMLLPLSATLQSIPAFNPIPAASSILQDIWESILRAVPKQRKSYSRTRSRQMAGKAIKDITSVVKCSSCGRPKRAHILCPYCVFEMKAFFQDSWSKIRKSFDKA